MTADERLALVRLKIERADKHINDFKAAVGTFLGSNPYKVCTKRNPDTRQLIYYIESVEPVPVCIPAITGDILNSLRSALDHLAQQLYLVGTGGSEGSYSAKVGFLISRSAKDFKSGLAGKVQGMQKDAVDAICALEPYDGGQGADLWTLHSLNNIDKHRFIVAVGTMLRSVGIGPIMERQLAAANPRLAEKMSGMMAAMHEALFLVPGDRLSPLKTGEELFIDAPDEEVNEKMKTSFRFDVAFNEPGVIECKPIQFSKRVSGIVEAFRPCLA
jgi:hypothetical protein